MRKEDPRALPSLEEPPPGTACERCGLELRILGFCPECHEHAMQQLEALQREAERTRQRAIRATFAAVRRRARTWQLDRLVHQ